MLIRDNWLRRTARRVIPVTWRKIIWAGWFRGRALSQHVALIIPPSFQSMVEGYFKRRGLRHIHQEFPKSTFVGPYEKSGVYGGIREEQWLWAHRSLIHGVVLDMSTPRYLHEWIYELPSVEKVLISDLCAEEVEKLGHKSKVDIIGDFGAAELPVSEESFDTILCLSILEHCEAPITMLRNMAFLLRPGGIAFFLCPFAYIDGHMGNSGPDYWRFCRDGYLLMARKAGLEVLETGQFGDLGKYFIFELGASAAATSWHRGVPIANWMICRRPG